jgi:hypothetical protein
MLLRQILKTSVGETNVELVIVGTNHHRLLRTKLAGGPVDFITPTFTSKIQHIEI